MKTKSRLLGAFMLLVFVSAGCINETDKLELKHQNDGFVEGGTLYRNRLGIRTVALSRDGRWLLAGTRNHETILWDAAAGTVVHRIETHERAVNGVNFNTDGSKFVSISYDQTAILWDRSTGRQLRTFHLLRSDGHRPDPGSGLYGPYAAFLPGESKLFTSSFPSGGAIWDLATGEVTAELRFGSDIVANVTPSSPDVIIGSFEITDDGCNGTIRVWDTNEPKHLATLVSQRESPPICDEIGEITSVAFAPEKSWVLSNSEQKQAILWNIDTEERIHTFEHQSNVICVAFSPDATRVVTGCEDGTAIVWDIATTEQLHVLNGEGLRIMSVLYSANGEQVVTACDGGKAILWDANTSRRIRVFEVPNS